MSPQSLPNCMPTQKTSQSKRGEFVSVCFYFYFIFRCIHQFTYFLLQSNLLQSSPIFFFLPFCSSKLPDGVISTFDEHEDRLAWCFKSIFFWFCFIILLTSPFTACMPSTGAAATPGRSPRSHTMAALSSTMCPRTPSTRSCCEATTDDGEKKNFNVQVCERKEKRWTVWMGANAINKVRKILKIAKFLIVQSCSHFTFLIS